MTERSLWAGIDQLRSGNRLNEVGRAVQAVAEAAGFSVVREYVGPRHRDRTIHVFYLPVAIRACDSFIDMHAVIKIRIIGYTVDPFPWHGNTFFIIFSELDNFGLVFSCYGMTIHACRHRGNGGMR